MQINVLVEDAESGDFIVFRQSKYAIPGETLAVHICVCEREREREREREGSLCFVNPSMPFLARRLRCTYVYV